eukprot:scaffold2224_cov261-Pinguiococcus_pyrenoidosus.AAC.1
MEGSRLPGGVVSALSIATVGRARDDVGKPDLETQTFPKTRKPENQKPENQKNRKNRKNQQKDPNCVRAQYRGSGIEAASYYPRASTSGNFEY